MPLFSIILHPLAHPCLVRLDPQVIQVRRTPSFLQDQHLPFHSQGIASVEPQILAADIAHNTSTNVQSSTSSPLHVTHIARRTSPIALRP
jgi:hypothetical protein